MRRPVFTLAACLLALAAAVPAAAQERPFVFSVSTTPAGASHALVSFDAGWGEGSPDVTDSSRAEQRISVQAALGERWTLLARVAISQEAEDTGTAQQGELLFNVLSSRARKASVGVGIGLRHELEGANVMLARVVAGRSFHAWRLDGNALFEKPFEEGRDTVDLITSVGVARQLASTFYAGIEMIGEDLEGFWEAEEAEGGARMLVGPSIRVAPASRQWQLSAVAGPIITATRSARLSDAARSLPPSTTSQDFGARASFSYMF